MSLSQVELIGVRVRVEWESFWVNLRKDNKVSESKMSVSESNMEEFKMPAIIKLSQNEWEKFFLCKMTESKMAKLKMAAIIKLSESLSQIELVWVRVLSKMAESKMGRIQDGCHHQVHLIEWVKFFLCKMVESNMAEFKMAAFIKLGENEWVWVRLN